MQYFAYSQKAFVYKYIVMLSDVDQFKHMSFANYLKLMFLASDALFSSFFEPAMIDQYRFKSVNARMQFKRQTLSGDHILIKINSTEIESTTFSLLHTFVIEGTGELVGLGRQTYQFTDAKNESPKELMPAIRSILGPIAVDEQYLVYKY